MKCKYCQKEFIAVAVNQKYCSKHCGYKYRTTHGIENEYPSITFACSKCGKIVVTDGTPHDKRTRFCSPECEKKYWRHPPFDHDSCNINFHSVQEYISWERRTNE